MIALQLNGNKNLIIAELDNPIPKSHEKLVTIEITGIGGSEYLGYKNTGIRTLPNIMGHGICGKTNDGIRVAINPLLGCNNCQYCNSNLTQLCTNWKLIGVQLNGGFTQQVVVPKTNLVELPKEISWEQSSFIEPFANSINAWEIANVLQNEKILIIGAGGIGLGLASCAHKESQLETYILEKSKPRSLAANAIGAKVAKYEENYYDVIFDTVGSSESRKDALKLLRRNGRCIFLGFSTAKEEVDFSELIRMQYRIYGSFVYSSEQFEKAVNLVKFVKTEWVKNVTFEKVESQLIAFNSNDFRVIKAALRPNKVNVETNAFR